MIVFFDSININDGVLDYIDFCLELENTFLSEDDAEYIVQGYAEGGFNKGYGYIDKVFTSIYDAIIFIMSSWDSEFIKVYEKDYGRLYVEVSHHDGHNKLEVRQLTEKGEDYLNRYWSLWEVLIRKGTTKNVKFSKRL